MSVDALALDDVNYAAREAGRPVAPLPSWGLPVDVAVDNVERAFGDTPALHGVSLSIRSGELVEIVYVEYKNLQFIYAEDANIVLMDKESFEQIYLPKETIGDGINYLKEGMDVKVWFESDEPISAEAPSTVELEVTYCEPGLKGDTATNTLKPATVETGAKISVPLFINVGDKIKIDTKQHSYMERVKN